MTGNRTAGTPDDETIISLLEERSEEALRLIGAKYGKTMRAIDRDICGSSEDAEEAVNDALLGVWNSVPPARPDLLSSYVYPDRPQPVPEPRTGQGQEKAERPGAPAGGAGGNADG